VDRARRTIKRCTFVASMLTKAMTPIENPGFPPAANRAPEPATTRAPLKRVRLIDPKALARAAKAAAATAEAADADLIARVEAANACF
jgi:hypothetical protein